MPIFLSIHVMLERALSIEARISIFLMRFCLHVVSVMKWPSFR